MTEPDRLPSSGEIRRVLAWAVRRALLGLASAVLFGATLGALIGIASSSPLGWVIGGALVGAIGGPVFGLVVNPAPSARATGSDRKRSARASGRVGGLVFGSIPLLLELAAVIRHGPGVLREDLLDDPGGLLGSTIFLAVSGAAFGASFGRPRAARRRSEAADPGIR